jgi:hypothetical protein
MIFEVRSPYQISRNAKISWIAALLLLATGSPAAANGTGTGVVRDVYATVNGIAFFSISGTVSSQPSCNTTSRWAINVSTAAGQSEYALVVAAYSQGKSVSVLGTGACDVWSDSETLER